MQRALEPHRAAIVDAVAQRVCKRSGSVFARLDVDQTRAHVDASLHALAQDLADGQREHVRSLTYAMLDALAPGGLSFSDFRLFIQTLRKAVAHALHDDTARRLAAEEWFFELLMVASLRFMAWREETAQKAAAQLGIRRLESQLEELARLLEEKTNLLEVIRQASTPIAPVYDGILVVPLVGTFDSFRAQLLTERLLGEIARLRARTAIIDISGVPLFDTQAAQLIIRLTRTARMLGTRVLLVGISPENARTIVALGIDLEGIETLATLRDALARALSLLHMHIAPLPEPQSR
jgi:anti-anti-sigma regulatory factor